MSTGDSNSQVKNDESRDESIQLSRMHFSQGN